MIQYDDQNDTLSHIGSCVNGAHRLKDPNTIARIIISLYHIYINFNILEVGTFFAI